jgi:hypothetical protein
MHLEQKCLSVWLIFSRCSSDSQFWSSSFSKVVSTLIIPTASCLLLFSIMSVCGWKCLCSYDPQVIFVKLSWSVALTCCTVLSSEAISCFVLYLGSNKGSQCLGRSVYIVLLHYCVSFCPQPLCLESVFHMSPKCTLFLIDDVMLVVLMFETSLFVVYFGLTHFISDQSWEETLLL